jgi:hypothetical protein
MVCTQRHIKRCWTVPARCFSRSLDHESGITPDDPGTSIHGQDTHALNFLVRHVSTYFFSSPVYNVPILRIDSL